MALSVWSSTSPVPDAGPNHATSFILVSPALSCSTHYLCSHLLEMLSQITPAGGAALHHRLRLAYSRLSAGTPMGTPADSHGRHQRRLARGQAGPTRSLGARRVVGPCPGCLRVVRGSSFGCLLNASTREALQRSRGNTHTNAEPLARLQRSTFSNSGRTAEWASMTAAPTRECGRGHPAGSVGGRKKNLHQRRTLQPARRAQRRQERQGQTR